MEHSFGYIIAICFIIIQFFIGWIFLHKILIRILNKFTHTNTNIHINPTQSLDELSSTQPFSAIIWNGKIESILFSYITGLYTSSIYFIFIGIWGMLNWSSVVIYLSASLISIIFVLIQWYRDSQSTTSSPHQPTNSYQRWFSSHNYLPLTIMVMVSLLLTWWLVPYFLQSLLPNADWDSAIYHLPNAKLFTQQSLLHISPSTPYTSMPGNIHLFYSLFMLLDAETAIIPFNLVTILLTALAGYALTQRLAGKWAGYTAFLIILSNNILMELGIDPRIDGFLALFLLMAFYGFLIWIENTKQPVFLCFTAIACSLSLGTKYTAVFNVAILGLFILLIGSRIIKHSTQKHSPQKHSSQNFYRPLVIAIVILLLPTGFWYIRNAIILKDPIYPLLKGRYYIDNNNQPKQLKQELSQLIAQKRSDQPDDPIFKYKKRIKRRNHQQNIPTHFFNLYDVWQRPNLYARKPLHFLSPFVFLFFLVPLFRRDKSSNWLFAGGMILFLIIGSRTFLLRYLLPILPLFAIGSAIVIEKMGSLLNTRLLPTTFRPFITSTTSTTSTNSTTFNIRNFRLHWWYLLWFLAISYVACSNHQKEWKKYQSMRGTSYLTGKLDRMSWIAKVGYNSTPAMPRAIKNINGFINKGIMSPKDLILMVGEEKGYLLNCKFIPDNSRYGSTWAKRMIQAKEDYQRLLANLQKDGITHILYNRGFYSWVLRKTKVNRDFIAYSLYTLERFLKKYTRTIYNKNGVRIAKIMQ